MIKINKQDMFELMNNYISGDISSQVLSHEYHEFYTLKINLEDLSEKEIELFDELLGISNRKAISDEKYEKHPVTEG